MQGEVRKKIYVTYQEVPGALREIIIVVILYECHGWYMLVHDGIFQ
jgi:hypothetical protein